jgi:hypothetical protein
MKRNLDRPFDDQHNPLIVWCPVTGVRYPRSEWEAETRRRFLGFQVACPTCDAGVGERCVTTSGNERKYKTMHDRAHHQTRAARVWPDLPQRRLDSDSEPSVCLPAADPVGHHS